MSFSKTILAFLLLFGLFIGACSKESYSELNSSLDDVALKLNSEGFLEFSSLDELYQASVFYAKDKSFQSQVDKMLPKSLNAVILGLQESDKFSKLAELPREFEHFIGLDPLQEKPAYNIVFPFRHYTPFLNKDGIIVLDGVYVKFSKSFVASSKDLQKLEQVNETKAQDLVFDNHQLVKQNDVLISKISKASIKSPSGGDLRNGYYGSPRFCDNNGYDRLDCWVDIYKTVVIDGGGKYDVSIDVVTTSRKDTSASCSTWSDGGSGSWYGSSTVSGYVSVRLIPDNIVIAGGSITPVNGSNTGWLGIAYMPCFHYADDWIAEPELNVSFDFEVFGNMAEGWDITVYASDAADL